MRIKRLKINTAFRGLPSGYEIVFPESEHNNKSTRIYPKCLVGLNGAGKSNVLEVITEIFFYLDDYHKATKKELGLYKTNFSFELEYQLPIQAISLAGNNWVELSNACEIEKEDPIILISKKQHELPITKARVGRTLLTFNNNDGNRESAVLPAKIIGYSSGMNELLSNAFIKRNFQYYEELNELDDVVNLNVNRMFFLNYESNKFVTLCNFLFDSKSFDEDELKGEESIAEDFGGKNLQHIRGQLGVDDIESFSIKFRFSKNKNISSFLHPQLALAIESLKKCSTFCDEEILENKTIDYWSVDLFFWVNDETKKAIRSSFGTAKELFRIFYFFNLMNLGLLSKKLRTKVKSLPMGSDENISDLLPKFEMDQLSFSIENIVLKNKLGEKIHYRKLSDGEHQLLQVIGGLMIVDDPGSLFLLDEPETHFNPDWRSRFVSLINSSVNSGREQEVILTTHSPFVVSDCKKENVFIFSRDENGQVVKAKNPSINTFGTSTGILMEDVFGQLNTISEMSNKRIAEIKSMELDSLSKIQKAKEASRELGESVEKVLLFRELIQKESEFKKHD